MVQSKAVETLEAEDIEKASNWELTEEEMESILLPTPEEYREDMMDFIKESIEKIDKMGITQRTCIGVIVNKKTGEIRYE